MDLQNKRKHVEIDKVIDYQPKGTKYRLWVKSPLTIHHKSTANQSQYRSYYH